MTTPHLHTTHLLYKNKKYKAGVFLFVRCQITKKSQCHLEKLEDEHLISSCPQV